MPITTKNDDINKILLDIKDKIQNKQIAVFCGAGISYNSGLPLVNNLLNYILNVIDVKKIDSEKILNSNLPFEAFIQTLAEESDIDEILNIFSKGTPNKSHQFIALLIKLGLVKNVITTNFDTLLEKALYEFNILKDLHYNVFSTESDFANIDWKNNSTKLIKIHGCISHKEEIEITLDLVARKYVSQNKHNIISSFFSKSVNPFVLFLGYSCSDVFDISPQIESHLNNQSEIIFIEHCFDENKFQKENIDIKEFKNPFMNYSGIRFYYNTDLLIANLWKYFSNEDFPKSLKPSINWEENINLWINKATEYSEGIKNQLSARLFCDIGEYNTAIRIWEKGLEIAQTEGNQFLFYSLLGNLGMSLNAIGKFNEAKACLEKSCKACKELGNIQGEISQLQVLGSTYRNLHEFESSIKVFKRAVFLSENYYEDSMCQSLGNLATVYIQTGNYEKAISTLKKGLIIAITEGNKQSEGSMLTNLGTAFFKKGDYNNGINLILKSIDITRQIGDKKGECMSLFNLSNICLQFRKFDECIKFSSESLEIASNIGIKPNEANALYNIGAAYLATGNKEMAIINLKKSLEIYNTMFKSSHKCIINTKKALSAAMK